MSRRDFLRMLGAATALSPFACAAGPGALAAAPAAPSPGGSPTPARTAGGPIRAIVFDLFTIFDPRSIIPTIEAAVPGQGAAFAKAWRTRQFDYGFIRSAADQFLDFRTITSDALTIVAREHKVELTPASHERLIQAYSELTPWPDSVAALRRMRAAGLRLAPLTNFSPRMLADLIRHAGLEDVFEQQLSTGHARQLKPHPRAYQLAIDRLGLPREQIALSAFGGWDAAGGTWFGYPTFWVNRLGVELEQLVTPTAIGKNLDELAAWATSFGRA